MAKKAALSRQERLAKLAEKIKNTDMGGQSSAGFWSPKEGKSTIRILPEVKTMEYFYQTVGRHKFPPDGKKHCYCPSFTSESVLPCPVCEVVDDLYKAGGDNKELAGKLRARKMYWMNVVVRGKRNKDGTTDPDTGPFIYTPGVTVAQQIFSLINDPDYGDIMDVNDGIDLTIERTGTGFDTEYQVTPRRVSSPLAQDQETLDKYLEEAKDLTYVEVSDDPSEDKELSKDHAVFVLPYDRLVREMDLDAEITEDEEEEEETPPAKKKAAAKPAAKPAKRPAKPVVEDDDEEEDDEEEDDEDEDDEEEEDEKPVKAKPSAQAAVQQRMARRSARK